MRDTTQYDSQPEKARCDIPQANTTAAFASLSDSHRQITDELIVGELFRYHSPSIQQTAQYEAVRDAAKYLATVFLKNVPAGADRSAAIRKLREAVMTANAGIALQGISL